jgi:electron transport complex protein RnfE
MSEKKNHLMEFTKGFLKENPTFVVVLGLCPTLGVSTQVANGIGMGLSALFVLFFSNILISAMRKVIPDSIHIPAYIVIISALVTLIQMFMQAYLPSLYSALGVYLPLIVVNCIILGRAEAFASKNGILDSALDALGMGLGLTMNLTIISLIREVFGAGTITLFATKNWDGVIHIPVLNQYPVRVMTLAAGALLLMGYLFPLFHKIIAKKESK